MLGWSTSKIALATCLLAAAGGVYAVYGTIAGYWTAGQPAIGAEHGKPHQAVAALGRIEPQSEIFNLSAGTATPDRLEQLFVARGDLVKKDQVLGYLGGYAEQAAQQEMFKAQLEEAKLGSLSCR